MIRLRVYDVDSESGERFEAGELTVGGLDGYRGQVDPPCMCQRHLGQAELVRLDAGRAPAAPARPVGGGVAAQ